MLTPAELLRLYRADVRQVLAHRDYPSICMDFSTRAEAVAYVQTEYRDVDHAEEEGVVIMSRLDAEALGYQDK